MNNFKEYHITNEMKFLYNSIKKVNIQIESFDDFMELLNKVCLENPDMYHPIFDAMRNEFIAQGEAFYAYLKEYCN